MDAAATLQSTQALQGILQALTALQITAPLWPEQAKVNGRYKMYNWITKSLLNH